MKKSLKRVLSLVIAMAMTASTLALTASAQTTEPVLSADEFAAPGMEYRPGVRWWLPGGAIDADEMAREVQLLADNGFGHAEINPFGGALSASYTDTAPHDNYLTDGYYDAIESAVATAAKNGFTIDLNMGSGWNANDPSVDIEDSLGNMAIGRMTFTVSADEVGQARTLTVPAMEVSSNYSSGKLTAGGTANLLSAMIARVAGKDAGHITKGTLTGASTEDQLLLDAASVTSIDLVGQDTTTVEWTPEAAGEYVLVGLYSYPTGCRPIDSVNAADGFVIDHMDYDTTVKYMENWMGEGTRIQDMMKKYPGTIQSFFNDSYEFYGDTYFNTGLYELAKDAESNPLGYDFSPYLVQVYKTGAMWPFYMASRYAGASNDTFLAMANADATAKDASVARRITYDYNQLTNQLFLEGMKGFQEVSNKYGGTYRQEAYNTPSDTIGSAKYVDIPEGEQQNENTLKRTASGSHLYNRPVTTAEQFTLGNTPFQNDLLKLKSGFDLMATAGVNNFQYHGFNYRYFGNEQMQTESAYGETGYCAFFGIGVNMTEANSLFPYYKELNAYAARVNYLGQVGKISMDAALYMEFNGSLSNTSGAGKVLNANGYTWDGINDDAIQNMLSYDKEAKLIRVEGSDVTYKAIVIQNASLPVATMEALQKLANEGANIVFFSKLPNAQPGYADGNYAAEDAKVSSMANAMVENGAAYAQTDAELVAALGSYDVVSHEANGSLRMIRRTLSDGSELAYVRSTDTANANTVVFTVPASYENVYLLDQNTGKIHRANVVGGQVEVTLVASGAVALLACPAGVAFAADELSAGLPQSVSPVYLGTAETKQVLALNDFTLSVTADNLGTTGAKGETRTVTYTENALGNWKDASFHDGELQFAAADGVYTTTLNLDETYDARFVLNLGQVATCASVAVNGEHVGDVLFAPYKLDITDALVKGENTIQITVTPRTWNRYAGFSLAYAAASAAGDQDSMNLYQYYKSVKNTTRVDAGLMGPVSVEVYNDDAVHVTVDLTGDTDVTVEQDTLSYQVALTDAVQVATATVSLTVSGPVADVTAEGVNGWYVIDQSYENGVLTVVAGNNAGLTGDGAILNVTAKTTGKTGAVSVELTDVSLSAYAGTAGESFVDAVIGTGSVKTDVHYSTYDVNQDGTVNQLDITRAQRTYGTVEGDANWNPLADVNHDGVVDINDLILILNNYSK